MHLYENNKSLMGIEEANIKMTDTFLTLAKEQKRAMYGFCKGYLFARFLQFLAKLCVLQNQSYDKNQLLIGERLLRPETFRNIVLPSKVPHYINF